MADGNGGSNSLSFGAVAGAILLIGVGALGWHNKDAILDSVRGSGGKGGGGKGGDASDGAKPVNGPRPDTTGAPGAGPPPVSDGITPIGSLSPSPQRKHNPPGMWRTWSPGTSVTLAVHSSGKPGVQRWTVGQSGRPETKVGQWLPMTPALQAESDASEDSGKLVPKAPGDGNAMSAAGGAAPGGTPGTSPLASLVGGTGSTPPAGDGSGATAGSAVIGLLGSARGLGGAPSSGGGDGVPPDGGGGGAPPDGGGAPPDMGEGG